MKLSHLLFFLIVAATGFGCSGTAKTSKKSADSISNSNAASDKNQNANTTDANSDAPPIVTRNRVGRRERIDVNPSATPLPPKFKKAAENSEAAITMNTDGAIFEIRVFKSHPQLAKVEATWLGAKEKTLKVYLRNGQVLDVTTDQLGDLGSATTAQILEIAGLKGQTKSSDRPRVANDK